MVSCNNMQEYNIKKYYVSGFTLVELMISLALGLIITAAAALLFLTGQKNIAMQKGAAELQDNANFGLNYITKDLRLTNLNTRNATINDASLYGGIVLTSAASDFVQTQTDTSVTPNVVTKYSNLPVSITTVGNTLLTQNNGITTVGSQNVWTGASNVSNTTGTALLSDQLVIQYLPQYTLNNNGTPSDTSDDKYQGGYDCEGNKLEFSELRYVIQRYFLRTDNNKSSSDASALSLACDAGSYPVTNPTAITGFGGAGEIIMKRVDYFHILLGVQTGTDTASTRYQYLSIADYMAKAAPRPRIISIQVGALVRSLQSVGADSAIKADQQFTVLDKVVKTKAAVNTSQSKYIRQVVSQTVALRNALGERE
ncbi:PilW family protein [Acinetobacter pittii]|uniref:PilW family protein n=1 Tax=Acinetobacter pittii TaxID=48296 RepID=UPI00313C722A